jgi:hypothetical protein
MMAKPAILRTPPIRASDSWDISSIDIPTCPLYASLSNSTLRHTLAPP